MDLDKLTNRQNIDSLKWDVLEGELPMSLADMDFEVCEEIVEAMKKRIDSPTFGYNIISDEWYDAYINWWSKYHDLYIKKEELLFSTGVVPTISSVVRRLTKPAEKVLIQTPVYNIFFNSIYNNGRYIVESPLVYDKKFKDYHIDFDDLENKLKDPQTTLMILCNPHNPIGKIWDYETLEKIGDLCYKYNVTVISDEIHCDITKVGESYIPFSSVNEICKGISVTCLAPTKAFNIAGLQTSAIYISSKYLRDKVNRGINNDEIAEPNSFAIPCTIAAFKKGRSWLYDVREYVDKNKEYVCQYIIDNNLNIDVVKSDATYLLWIDCSNYTNNSLEFTQEVRKLTGLILNDGLEYGESGRTFVRMNVACPKIRLIDGLNRLKKALEIIQNKVIK